MMSTESNATVRLVYRETAEIGNGNVCLAFLSQWTSPKFEIVWPYILTLQLVNQRNAHVIYRSSEVLDMATDAATIREAIRRFDEQVSKYTWEAKNE